MQKRLTIKDIISQNLYFFIPYFVFLAAGAVTLYLIDKGDAVIWFNEHHDAFYDNFFYYSSMVGKGIIFGYFLLFLGIIRFRYLLIGLSTFLGSGLVAQILKHLFKEPRPKAFFENFGAFSLVEGISVYSSLSFPSGHTTAGFSIFIFFSLITKYKPAGLIYFLCAASIGLSRIYLVQHFLIDVYFGSIVGTFISIMIYQIYKNNKIDDAKWFNYSLINKLKFYRS